MHSSHAGTHAPEAFPTDPTGLPEATAPAALHLSHGDTLELEPRPVAKRLRDATVRMLAYNGSIPGPTLTVAEGSEMIVHVINRADIDTTLHWHGLRLENRYDGVPHETQTPIPVGGEFTYRIRFPDPGLYWYHPHIREDYTQEMGLYGTILVEPADPDYWPPVPLAGGAHPRRHPARRHRQDRAVQPDRNDLRRYGPLRQPAAHRRRNRPR